MAENSLWQGPEGASVINSIISKRISQWTDGLRLAQLEAVARILDGKDFINCAATGSRKSALFFVPILIHMELSSLPSRYPSHSQKA